MGERADGTNGQDERSVDQLVVVGASAGGVQALSTLVATLPADFPAPIVVAQHIDPRRPSHLGEILRNRSALRVRTVMGYEALECGVVYVVPADRDIEISDHHVDSREPAGGASKPSVDRLMASAARVFSEDLIAVVLTGTGADGATGAQAVKALGGTVIVQNPETASFSGMPLAVPPTAVDIVAELEAIGPLLVDLLSGAYVVPPASEDGELRSFLDRVRERTGLDFGAYKRPTIGRRLQRRMAAVGTASLADYRRYLERHPEELQRLVASFLIKVTEFFRDPDLFAYLRDQVLPALVDEARGRGELRLWSAGSATGEEAYTLAMLVADLLGDELGTFPVRIFATDVATDAIEFARRGVYTEAALTGLPPEMVERHFVRVDGAYEVRKPVRSLVVFGEHDLAHRAPFPRIDLVLCRNVLIYFTPELQRRALQVFAFSLRRGGYLALGKAETINPLPEFFALEQPRLRIFRRVGESVPVPAGRLLHGSRLAPYEGHLTQRQPSGRRLTAPAVQATRETPQGQQSARTLEALAVGVVTVERSYHIRTINAAARRMLGIRSAAIGEDLVHRVLPPLAGPLRLAIDGAFRGESTAAQHRVPGDVVEDGERDLAITVYPAETGEVEDAITAAVVAVVDVTALIARQRELEEERTRFEAEAERQAARAVQAITEVIDLRSANQTLTGANAALRAENEELQIAGEEAQAAAEEIETLNEEQQATNEELETLNEELQATIEELTTTNDELQARGLEMQELAAARDAERSWLAAVLGGIGDAVLVVDRAGRPLLTNAAYRRLFGSGEIVPEDESRRALPPEETPQRLAAGGEAFSMTFTVGDAEGSRRWYEATGQPLEHDGAAQGGVVTIRDISDRNLRRLQDQWLGIASHELRTRLTALQGMLQMAERRQGDAERVRRYVGQAREQARRLGGLVEELVDAVRLQDGRLRLTRRPLELGATVGGAVETARMLTQGQAIELAEAGEPLWVHADAGRLEQVLLNLLTNAIAYAPGTERIDVRLRREDGSATIEVQDYGQGIPPTEIERIFTRYYQADRPGDGASAGLGLGLFIAQEIVAAHGGTIEARSTEGEGTTFAIRLPLLAEDGTGAEDGIGVEGVPAAAGGAAAAGS